MKLQWEEKEDHGKSERWNSKSAHDWSTDVLKTNCVKQLSVNEGSFRKTIYISQESWKTVIKSLIDSYQLNECVTKITEAVFIAFKVR